MEQKQVYQTKNRKLIWEFIIAQKNGHFSANDVFRHFTMSETPISMPTIYRQLEKMIEDGLLQKYRTAESETAFYCYVGEEMKAHEHPLMKCTSCGKTVRLQCNTAEELANHIGQEHHFFVRLKETVFYGECESCTQSHSERI